MALRLAGPSLLHALLPAAQAPLRPALANPILRPLGRILPPIRIPASLAALISVPSLLGEIWESILRAVPKKKTSHMKKRHRQLAGKALKDVTSMCRCSSCGRVKLMLTLCPYCTQSVRAMARKAANLFPAGMLMKKDKDLYGKAKRQTLREARQLSKERRVLHTADADNGFGLGTADKSWNSNHGKLPAVRRTAPETKGWKYVKAEPSQPSA